eukprot:4731926-Karenia_brevis.AAC.1
MLEAGPEAVINFRREKLQHYDSVRKSLESKEDALKRSLHVDVRSIVQRKNILLFQRMLADIRYDDPGVADYLVQGVKTMGLLSKTGIWRLGGIHPSANLEAVLRCAKEAQRAMLAKRAHNDIDVEVWKATMLEVEE